MTTGEKIRASRLKRGLTQEELGRKLGTSKSVINKYESGVISNLKRPMIEALAVALDTTPAYLMGWEDLPVNAEAPQNEQAHMYNASEEIRELVRVYSSLPVKARISLLSYAYTLEEESEK